LAEDPPRWPWPPASAPTTSGASPSARCG
jgi:hypothetical protein